MHSLLVIYNKSTAPERKPSAESVSLPENLLRSCGYLVETADDPSLALDRVRDADASILHIPISDIQSWSSSLLQKKIVPILWWCSDSTATLSVEACEDRIMVDGILSPSMLPQEVHWALHFGAKQCFERQQWNKEREQLLSRLEERKWIDMAKGVLCKVKNISESEAYDLLRKQAMNERKRMVDVATSIVKVYELLQDQKQGRAKK
ncbi:MULTISPECIES: ANTAR domain-containing response regulator [Cohnella]|uniref:ANTAR domain-containing response regulator n=1 Tax=Cohnella TaxID=329857 RepID=UPI0009BBF460|nr:MULTISPECIES: ANTAR domain-containing protein [Cohnella]MBN2982697.1 ANTAR domain-containing protein [Cohnella algarum]